jgi:hypothetical protein
MRELIVKYYKYARRFFFKKIIHTVASHANHWVISQSEVRYWHNIKGSEVWESSRIKMSSNLQGNIFNILGSFYRYHYNMELLN